ncbi:peptidyl-prolyl cis-trans isomerase [Chondromyces crocatus]|uniref:Peptidyl-prolyl cis-trans isomerase n=1 Tax=Chondromyces crocatus TaxID=52 RepID=A0A0K1EN73_CHOCO|nr:peptidyl-prolyl cis-trans isomerase [Chondromyces crocatus]AKT42291.1 peptidyl-prolyl cis-trans isomerase [Chondromyces crocatus]
MRARWRNSAVTVLGAAVLAAVVAVGTSSSVRADAREDAVVARVGDAVITVRDVERRMGQMAPFQLVAYGSTQEEIRKRFVDEVMIRDLLLAQGAEQTGVKERPEVQERRRSVLRGALLGRMRAELVKTSPVSDEEVRVFYEANKEKFVSPARVALWRILVATREEAAELIAELQKASLDVQKWNDLAREKSLDKSSSLRGGNLGFVLPDGATTDPELQVDPRLLEAASKVKDAELVPEPVPEGKRWAVVWRRQSMKAVTRPLEQEGAGIRQMLAHQKADAQVKELLARLRKEHLSEFNPEAVSLLEVSTAGELQPTRRPGALPASRKPSAPSLKDQKHQHQH